MYKIPDPPRLSIKNIETFVKDSYSLIVNGKSLVSDIGQNFHLIDSQGKEYILKIANETESTSMLEAQNAAIEHLRSKNLDFRLPDIIKRIKLPK
jgi:Ser/Thr protein kinase RdoA (MazF antagonist)